MKGDVVLVVGQGAAGNDPKAWSLAAASTRAWSSVMDERAKLPAACFLWIEDKDKKGTWHLPVYEGGGAINADTGMYERRGSLNINGVRAALQRLPQMSPAPPAAVVSKLKGLARRLGIGELAEPDDDGAWDTLVGTIHEVAEPLRVVDVKDVHLLREGVWIDCHMNKLLATVEAMADIPPAYEVLAPRGFLPGVKLGDHDDENTLKSMSLPSMGRVGQPHTENGGKDVYGDINRMPAFLGQMMQLGHYNDVSCGLWGDVRVDDRTFQLVLDHVAILGIRRPAVSGLDKLESLQYYYQSAPERPEAVSVHDLVNVQGVTARVLFERPQYEAALPPNEQGGTPMGTVELKKYGLESEDELKERLDRAEAADAAERRAEDAEAQAKDAEKRAETAAQTAAEATEAAAKTETEAVVAQLAEFIPPKDLPRWKKCLSRVGAATPPFEFTEGEGDDAKKIKRGVLAELSALLGGLNLKPPVKLGLSGAGSEDEGLGGTPEDDETDSGLHKRAKALARKRMELAASGGHPLDPGKAYRDAVMDIAAGKVDDEGDE